VICIYIFSIRMCLFPSNLTRLLISVQNPICEKRVLWKRMNKYFLWFDPLKFATGYCWLVCLKLWSSCQSKCLLRKVALELGDNRIVFEDLPTYIDDLSANLVRPATRHRSRWNGYLRLANYRYKSANLQIRYDYYHSKATDFLKQKE